MRNLKFKAQPTKCVCRYLQTHVRQLLPASDYCRALPTYPPCYLNCAQRFDYRALDSSRNLVGAAEHWLTGVKNAFVSWALEVIPQYSLRILTTHNFRLSAPRWARARTQARLNSEINTRFLLNKHGDLYFYCIIIVYILSSLIEKEKQFLGRKRRCSWKRAQNSYSRMQTMTTQKNDSTNTLRPRRFKWCGFFPTNVIYCSICFRISIYQLFSQI